MTLEQWRGLNQQAKRGTIDDNEEWWDENLFAISPGALRSCWGASDAIYTAPSGTKIVRIFFGFIGYPTPQFAAPGPPAGGRLGWMFLDNGVVDQVDLDTKQVTTIGNIWEPIPPYFWADAVVWRPRFFGSVMGQNGGVLFGSPQGLYAWDGQTLSSPGDNAPDWLTDQAENAPPPVPGPTIMPEGLPGIYALEVYQERLFVAGKDVISFSAPSNGADFSTANGGGSIGYFGDKLTYTYMALAASSGYLYVFGDSSTDLISNVQLTGQGTTTSPFITNLNYQNVDPQVGHGFPRHVGRWGRYFTMCNGAPLASGSTDPLAHRGGIYLMQGGDAQLIGQKVSQIYMTLDVTDFYPTFAPATMFGFRVMLLNGQFRDPWGVKRSLLLMWHGEFWSVASQNLNLTHIDFYEQDSVITPYGTDGTSLYQLFARPDPALKKKLSTKKLRGSGQMQLTIKDFKRLYLELSDNYGAGVSLTGTNTSGGGGVPGGVQDIGFNLPSSPVSSEETTAMPPPQPFEGVNAAIIPQPIAGSGIWTAIDLESLSPDFTIERLHILAEGRTLFGA